MVEVPDQDICGHSTTCFAASVDNAATFDTSNLQMLHALLQTQVRHSSLLFLGHTRRTERHEVARAHLVKRIATTCGRRSGTRERLGCGVQQEKGGHNQPLFEGSPSFKSQFAFPCCSGPSAHLKWNTVSSGGCLKLPSLAPWRRAVGCFVFPPSWRLLWHLGSLFCASKHKNVTFQVVSLKLHG